MKILIVNDDGIDSSGLRRLVEASVRYGEIWVVAPDGERSCASHSMTIKVPVDIYPVDFGIDGVHAFKCTGLPTDCFRIASQNVMPSPPDIVFSGINNGFNMGTDIQYSATVGAALDAAMCGYPVIAFSEGFQGDARQVGDPAEVTLKYLPTVLEELIGTKSSGNISKTAMAPGRVVNVNFPDCSPGECKGILYNRKVSNTPFVDYYTEEDISGGGKRYTIHWVERDHAEEGTDVKALLDGYVSIGIVNNIS